MRGKVATKTACLAISGITPAYAGKSIFCISGAQRRRDHPRVCGEKSKTALSYDSIRGSPPRMRGKGSNFVQIETFAGITPAYAGKRGKPMHAASEMWDHPRVCGEKARTSAPRLPATGSPPRMRGKGTAPRHLVQCCRITPAYAGKSFNGSFLSFLFEDHPRVCGEKLKRLRKNYEKPGSPPRMRGKDDRRRMSASEQRITPAYAGKSHAGVCGDLVEEDHPRVCGEKMKCLKLSHRIRGSPPRMRGKACSDIPCSSSAGITPAYAGKRACTTMATTQAKDHPRVCGEKQPVPRRACSVCGSPPRMRGKGVKQSNRRIRMGITPAYAGKRILSSQTHRHSRDHPRVCGEKIRVASPRITQRGSPPRMRGKVPCVLFFGAGIGITPAYAGKSMWLR